MSDGSEKLVTIAYRKDGKTYLLAMPSDHAEWAEEMLSTDLAATIREAKAEAWLEAVELISAEEDAYVTSDLGTLVRKLTIMDALRTRAAEIREKGEQ